MDYSRKTVIGGNWKMNLLPSQVSAYAEELKKHTADLNAADVIVAPPFIMLPAAVQCFEGTGVFVAAQNVSEHLSGAFTGEVSALQLRDLGVTHVIAGHSERRTVYGETDAQVNAKVLKILENGMQPILCVGESEEIRDEGKTEELIASQLKAGLNGVSEDDISRVIIAYEPIWAIGTGRTATAVQAEAACCFIRAVLSELYFEKANAVSIIYGGSMNAENAAELLAAPNIDGGLIGGASLEPSTFAQIINTANTSTKEG